MTTGDDKRHSPDEQRALEAVRGLASPRASETARARTRAAFLAAAAASGPAESPAPVRLERRRAPVWVPLAAAAVLALAAIGIWQFATGPSALWRVTNVVEASGVSGAPTEGFVMEYGRISTGPDTELELQLGDQFRFNMRPGTTIELPRPPRRWQPGEMVITLTSGEIFGIAEDLDAPLRVIARNSETLVHGTTFAVFQTPDASCTCLWKGSVEITNRADGTTVTLEPNRRFFVYDDGSVSGPQPLDAMETMKLQMMHDAGLLPDPVDDL
jgi:ferric-dicitrate binding protein FerR (iron transport regulator)